MGSTALKSQPAVESFSPGPRARTVRDRRGAVLSVPADWVHLPPGDAALTRRVKLAGPHWRVQENKGGRVYSHGLWAPAELIERIRKQLFAERSTASYAKRRQADAERRRRAQAEYVEDFFHAVMAYLAFHNRYQKLAQRLARAVTLHATPVGSGTVARTKRIPVEKRAEAAVIAWLRHQTTAYDAMTIPRTKGKRREVRRMLAQKSKELLESYRRGKDAKSTCPLVRTLSGAHSNPKYMQQIETPGRPLIVQ